MGLKGITVYRNASKGSQPLNITSDSALANKPLLPECGAKVLQWGERRQLHAKQTGMSCETRINGSIVSVKTGEFEDGQPGMLTLDLFQEDSAYRVMTHCFAMAVSLGFQYGVPLEKFLETFRSTRFQPYGLTSHPVIQHCTSVLDFTFRVLALEYLNKDASNQNKSREESGHLPDSSITATAQTEGKTPDKTGVKTITLTTKPAVEPAEDEMRCYYCGYYVQQGNGCYRCLNCGYSDYCGGAASHSA
jgi:ribonucleoside-diphosphate reductase alpha chain